MKSATRPEFGLGKIGQIAVPVSDLERAITFYRDVLG
jgi:methylmalonyl-CoA/ethylmalonyl-CoA epimerase